MAQNATDEAIAVWRMWDLAATRVRCPGCGHYVNVHNVTREGQVACAQCNRISSVTVKIMLVRDYKKGETIL